MGFKSASQKAYPFHKFIFPSRQIYLKVNDINKKLELLYPPIRGRPEFDDILKVAEEYIDEFKKDYDKIYIVETDDFAFGREFCGIWEFLNEAFDIRDNPQIRNQTPKDARERFLQIAKKLWDVGMHPSEI